MGIDWKDKSVEWKDKSLEDKVEILRFSSNNNLEILRQLSHEVAVTMMPLLRDLEIRVIKLEGGNQ